MVCSLFLIFFSISSNNLLLIIHLFPFASSCLKSTISTDGSDKLLALFVSVINSISPDLAFEKVVTEGVALPKH